MSSIANERAVALLKLIAIFTLILLVAIGLEAFRAYGIAKSHGGTNLSVYFRPENSCRTIVFLSLVALVGNMVKSILLNKSPKPKDPEKKTT